MIVSGYILLIVAAVASLLLRGILSYVDLLPAVRFPVRLVGLLLLTGGIVLTLFSSEKLNQAERVKQWPTTTGVIVNSYLEGTRALHPIVEYRYRVDSVSYVGQRAVYIPNIGGKKRMKEVAAKTRALFYPGDTMKIYYDQSNHSDSRIHAGASWDIFGQLGFGLFLVIGSILLISLPRKQT